MEGKWVRRYRVTPPRARGQETGGLTGCGGEDGGSTGGSRGGLVPTAAGPGGVSVWVLEVDAAVPRCMCRVLGVCLWHLFCCSDKKT